jgi:hypothetical protein
MSMGIKFAISVKTLISSGYVRAKESLYTRVIIWDNIILYQIDDTGTILPRYEYGPEWYREIHT